MSTETGRQYRILVQCSGQRSSDGVKMMVFLDDRFMYEVDPGENICFLVTEGFHALKFRRGIRSKDISLVVNSGYIIKSYFNTLSGLIETNVAAVDETMPSPELNDLNMARLTEPVMISENGARGFEVLLGDDSPEYEIKCTSGLESGILRLYSQRIEFCSNSRLKNDVTRYADIVDVNKKMGSVDIVCGGNVHKVYSIPKDIYNEFIAFLTNRIAETGLG
ncbi:MAG: hypothetical protein K6G10_11315 [Butyrivibrio sp.]|nr:hypothetical protein [Butyrivibrio sp.]